MPEILRQPIRFDCTGMDIVHPVDRMPPGAFPFLSNVRVIREGEIEGRPGYSTWDSSASAPKLLHSIRRLNDADKSYAPAGYINLVGNGTILEAGAQNALTSIASGFSGKPLSIVLFRPEQSPESWAYVYDENKLVKVRPDKVVREVGVAPPTTAPDLAYGTPAWVTVADGQNATGWSATGAATSVTLTDRQSAAANTIAYILYDSGNTGWCCFFLVSGSSGDYSWAGSRMQIQLNPGGGNQETVVVRDILPAMANTTIAGIKYDSGANGLCSIVFTGNPAGVVRDSLFAFTGSGELVRVLSVNLSPDGSVYSIRCRTAGTYTAGTAITGLICWRAYTNLTHAAGEAVSTQYLAFTQPAAGVGVGSVKVIEDAGTANGRPISIADDYLHVSLFIADPSALVSIKLLVDVDAGTPAGTPFTQNYYTWTLTPAQLGLAGGTNIWVDVSVLLSEGIRTGNDSSRNLTDVEAVGISVTSTGACDFGFDWWYNFGTYGPVIQPNSPTGYLYESRDRDSTTGAASVPGPRSRFEMFPLREAIIVTPQATTATGVDSLDIYRQGGTLTDFVYDGTVANNFASPNSFTDGLPDTSIIGAPAADTSLLQPWPLLGLAWQGFVNVVGTSVTLVSGTQFNTALVSGSVILINGVAYQTYGQPPSANFLEIFTDAGVQNNVPYLVASPTLAGQPLPYAFGPLEGPLVPIIFALGDPVNEGTLYWTNPSDGDSASDQNSIEITAPSEPLISGQNWNGIVICGSRDNVFLVRYSYLQTLTFQYSRLPSASGMWSRWSTARGPDGVYFLGRDGIYRGNESSATNITDPQLYNLFPHDGQPATGTAQLAPVDMTQLTLLRLTAGDFDVYFDYLDTNGQQNTLRYEIAKQRWFRHSYGDVIITHYLVDEAIDDPSLPQILMLSSTLGNIYSAGGNDDNGVGISSQAGMASFDGGEQRAQKLYIDMMCDNDGTGTLTADIGFNNGTTFLPPVNLTLAGVRIQQLINIASLADLSLYRNITVNWSWTGGPAGPRLIAAEPSGYVQPYLSTRVVTQFISLDFAGAWLHHRRMYPALISNSDVTFIIKTQDGRTYTFTIPSTGGQLRWLPQMLDQNIKDLGFAYEIFAASPFALFQNDFVIELKSWTEPSYIPLAIWKT